MSTLEEDLKPFQTVDLAAEVARRLGAEPASAPAPRAAPAKKATKEFKKRSEWARDQIANLERNLAKVEAEYATADGMRRKQTAIATITAEIQKFRRIATAAERKGE
ncbi:hypothetical protein GIY21_00930 [Xanthomonas sontii]|uniref:Uncharacterized protein n=1 Tax=Xanthomonas sontii TaxID=2650745 RepID=A0A6N7QD93_9XANT|nr:hypothetical protein [Xanthomonas sontii]MRG98851.1 hypothetical protein [Xanthomonas sontii]MRH73358.1 hypothetical protein [Xanthomonas sontii]